jgi:hypothetical protein
MMSDYILSVSALIPPSTESFFDPRTTQKHKNDSGIVYCLAKKVHHFRFIVPPGGLAYFVGCRKRRRRTVHIQSGPDQDRCLPR